MNIETQSLVAGRDKQVTIDPYDLNPLAFDFFQANTAVYDVARAKAGPPPKMFAEGTSDLPAFTASGLDPQQLLRLPYTARHYVAALPDLAEVHEIFEEFAADPTLYLDHPGFQAAVRRTRAWASGEMDRTPDSDDSEG